MSVTLTTAGTVLPCHNLDSVDSVTLETPAS